MKLVICENKDFSHSTHYKITLFKLVNAAKTFEMPLLVYIFHSQIPIPLDYCYFKAP